MPKKKKGKKKPKKKPDDEEEEVPEGGAPGEEPPPPKPTTPRRAAWFIPWSMMEIMDAIIKVKIERIVLNFIVTETKKDPLSGTDMMISNAAIYGDVRKKITDKEREHIGGGEDDDVDAATELALENLEEAGFIEPVTQNSLEGGYFPPGDPDIHGWCITKAGRHHHKRYSSGSKQ